MLYIRVGEKLPKCIPEHFGNFPPTRIYSDGRIVWAKQWVTTIWLVEFAIMANCFRTFETTELFWKILNGKPSIVLRFAWFLAWSKLPSIDLNYFCWQRSDRWKDLSKSFIIKTLYVRVNLQKCSSTTSFCFFPFFGVESKLHYFFCQSIVSKICLDQERTCLAVKR